MPLRPIRRLAAVLVSSLTVTFLIPASGSAQSAEPATPATRRATELVAVLNAGKPDSTRSYLARALAPAFLERVPLERHVEIWGSAYAEQGGFELERVDTLPGGRAEAHVRGRRTGDRLSFIVGAEPGGEHRIAGLGLRLVPPAPAAAPADSAATRRLTDAEIAAELDRHLTDLAARDMFAGAVLLAREGRPFFHRAYGPADRNFDVPNRPDTKFNLGSMNKMFTAVAIAQLAEQGKLRFDDPIGKHLPAGSMRPEVLEKVRIEHLLTHTSGLGSYFSPEWDRQSRALFRTVSDWMPLVKDETLAFEPGTQWAYSNTGFLVLGRIIETASGEDYFDYVREHIFRPAGMANTDSYELDQAVKNLAVGYQPALLPDGTVGWRNNTFAHVLRGGPAGGGYSTAADLLAFATAMRENRLVRQETRDLLWSPKPELSSPEYGYGFGIEDGGRTVGHTGGFTGISSSLSIRLDEGLTVVSLSNVSGGSQRAGTKVDELVGR